VLRAVGRLEIRNWLAGSDRERSVIRTVEARAVSAAVDRDVAGQFALRAVLRFGADDRAEAGEGHAGLFAVAGVHHVAGLSVVAFLAVDAAHDGHVLAGALGEFRQLLGNLEPISGLDAVDATRLLRARL